MHPAHPIVVLDYRVRLPGMLFIAVFAVAHFGGRRQSPLLVAAMVLTALWPHAAYLLAKNAKDTKQAELRNLLFDSFIVGCWMVAMSLSLWPAVARAGTIMNGYPGPSPASPPPPLPPAPRRPSASPRHCS